MKAQHRSLALSAPLDLRRTLGPLRTGRADPSLRLEPRAALRASLTPQGPATVHLRVRDGRLEATGWGAGAGWALRQVPRLVGDPERDWAPGHPVVARAHHRRPGLRLAVTGHVADILVPTVLGQQVTAAQAHRAWAGLVHRWGTPAPGPVEDLRVPPAPAVLARRPYWELHPLGVERRRAEVLRRASRQAERLQGDLTDPDALARRLRSLWGIGPWTTAIVLRHAAGDPDTVEVGDYHLKNLVAWNLAGEPRASDRRMLELLEPFAGRRGRVVLLLRSAGRPAPRYGPRRRGGLLSRRAP